MSTEQQNKRKMTETKTVVEKKQKTQLDEINSKLEQIGEQEYALLLTMKPESEQYAGLLRSAALHRQPDAMYFTGLKCRKHKEFVWWMSLAANKGHAMANYALAHYYLGKNGNEEYKDWKKSLGYFEKVLMLQTAADYMYHQMYAHIFSRYIAGKLNCVGVDVSRRFLFLDNLAVTNAVNDIIIHEKPSIEEAVKVYSENWGPVSV